MTSGGQPLADSHDRLFALYLADMTATLREVRPAVQAGRPTWGGRGSFRAIAAAKARQDHDRLCTHPRVIALIRKYFFACHALNQQCHRDEFILPAVFAVDMLVEANEALFWIFSELPYLPIGLDEDDRYV
jgi:hypothetical protein